MVAGIYEPIRDVFAWAIPEEALLDLGVNAYKSCVITCRRAVQGVLLDHGVNDHPNMMAMIDEAHAKGVLQQEQKETGNAVRFFAVTGAHPKDPLLRRVTELQASLAIGATKDILMNVYPLKPEYGQPASQSETGSNEQ